MEFAIRITGQTLKRVLLGVGAAVATAGLVFLGLFLFRTEGPLDAFVDERAYQAVFLTDGRAYIGRLTSERGDYYVLRDVYYLQQSPDADDKKQPMQQVLPRTADLHSPQARMLIPKDAVLLIENLRRDAELSTTIDRLRAEVNAKR